MRLIDRLESANGADDPLIGEIYDQMEEGTADVELLRRLLQGLERLNILECFSGTGRILIPLARDGHRLTGIDISRGMTARAITKLNALDKEVRERVTLIVGDVLKTEWGGNYDVVVLGGNCFGELPSAEAQEECIRRAWEVLVCGGHLFVDNNDWRNKPDRSLVSAEYETWLSGTVADGAYVEFRSRTVDVDVVRGIIYYGNIRYNRSPDGSETTVEFPSQGHYPSGDDVECWIRKCGFRILEKFGDRDGNPYQRGMSGRAIFWAGK